MQNRREFTYKEEAIPLVELDPKTNKFIVNDEAIAFLNSLRGNIGVVGVAGMYRTGKSYLLNRMLLDRSSGFGVGPSVNPCTKGLWIWGTPIKGHTPDGDPIDVIVVDSEGIGALDEDSTHDSRIFSLTVLLSSCFLYNSTGSIDENAIQNLSLIVNLTRNVHIKSHMGGDEPDSEDYAKYFPTFVWIVRDFTLQLVDAEGEPISSKEYLERSLAPQKGFSDGIEQKNRIRRLLTSFFKERECFTLVRPLTNETNLQSLEEMDIDQLRPEFASRIIGLRRFIINRIKPKTMNNKNLNGEMYSELVKSYIHAINEGAVPNIENSWSYVCRNECMKAMVEGVEVYENFTRDVINNKLPLSLEDLKAQHLIAKEKATAIFKKKAVGDTIEEYAAELRKKIKAKYSNLKQENEHEFSQIASIFISREYCTIEKMLKNNEYRSFSAFEKDLRAFQAFFLESGPDGPNKKLVIVEFLQKALNEGAIIFMKNLRHDLELQKMISQDLQKKLEQEINDLKSDNSKEKQFLLSKVSQLEYERSELEVREKNLKETVQQIREDKEAFESELRNEWQAEKEANQRMIQDLRAKLLQNEEAIKDTEKQVYLNKSEHDTEKALLEQRAQHYEKSLEEVTKREKALTEEMKAAKKEYLEHIRETSSKYEVLNKALTTQVEQLQDKVVELEDDVSIRNQKYEAEKRKWDDSEQRFTKALDDAQAKVVTLQQELQESRESQGSGISELKEEAEQRIEELIERNRSLEHNLKQKDEMCKTLRSSFEKEKALMLQKMEFLEDQLNESKRQITQMKADYDIAMSIFSDSNRQSSPEAAKQIEDLKETHRLEIKHFEAEMESLKKRLSQQLEELTEKNNELELNAKFSASDMRKEIESLKEELEQSEHQRKIMASQNCSLDSQMRQILQTSEERYGQQIRDLENDLRDQKEQREQDLEEINRRNEESLSQLRNFYEMEKERLERRITEEKDRAEKKVAEITEEYETRAKEEQGLHEDEMDNLKEDLREIELQSSAMAQQYERELMLRQQTIETLEKHLKEVKENFNSSQTSHNSMLENHLSSFAVERTQLTSRVDTLNHEVSKRDREIFSLSQIKEQLETNLVKKEAMLEKVKGELTREKNELEEAVVITRSKLQKLNDEYLAKKVEFNTDIALSRQQNEFLTQKIEEQQKQIDEVIKRYEEKIKIQKEEHHQELTDKLEKLTEEKAMTTESLEKTKKALKEIEATYNKQLSQLGKEKALLQEKHISTDQRLNDADNRLLTTNQNHTNQMNQLRETFVAEKKLLIVEAEKYKNQFLQLEQDHSEVISDYERDKALWKGKFHFLEQQKEQAKSDLATAQSNFEKTLTQLQIMKKTKEQENESNQGALIASAEKRFQAQIQQLNDIHAQKMKELEDKNQKLEKESSELKKTIQLETHKKTNNETMIVKKMNEMAEREKRILIELENVKIERDVKISEIQKGVDKERDDFKRREKELEQKLKESESKRSSQPIELERQRVRWESERDNLLNQKADLQEALNKLEKKKDLLIVENEKLKAEKAKMKSRPPIGSGVFMTSNNPIQKSLNYHGKINLASPDESRASTSSLDKNSLEIGNKNTDGSGLSHIRVKTSSTVITSDDEV